MKYTFFALFLFFFLPFPLSAKEKVSLLSRENTLQLSGTCTMDIRVSLTSVGDADTVVYTSGTACKDETFEFTDDLTRWNLPEGQYTLWVNGDPQEKRVSIKSIEIKVERVEAEEVMAENVVIEEARVNTFEKALLDFNQGLEQMKHSLGIIEENLSENDYTEKTVKMTFISVMRNALDTLTGFFTDFTSDENQDILNEATPEVLPISEPGDTSTQEVSDSSSAPEQDAPEKSEIPSETSIIPIEEKQEQ